MTDQAPEQATEEEPTTNPEPPQPRRRVSATQEWWLLQPVQPHRVALDPGGHHHLPQQDVRAHLIRLFGFCGHSVDVKSTELVFEQPIPPYERYGKTITDRVDVCYRAVVRLTVFDPDGNELSHWEDTSTGDAQNQTRLAGHDLALKSAVSTAIKRAATNLGDQFGLSLYNKGSMAPFVLRLLGMETEQQSGDIPAATPEEEPTDQPGTDMVPAQPPVGRSAPPRTAPAASGRLPVQEQFAGWLALSMPEWSTEHTRDKVMAALVTMGVGDITQATQEQWQALWNDWKRNGIPIDEPPAEEPSQESAQTGGQP